MTIDEHIKEFAGLPVRGYVAGESIRDPAHRAFRLGLDWEQYENDERFADLLGSLVADPEATAIRALIVGDWGGVGEGNDSAAAVEAVVSARDRLPELRALFFGELTAEESEISWIAQSDLSSLLEAYPRLEQFYVRGGNGLTLGRPRHDALKKLVIETGGLPVAVVREVASADLPELEHLELWLGDDGYGNDVAAEDIAPILSAELFPKLKYLGLRDDCRADETAALLARTDFNPSIEALDLSLGTLTDEGAARLAESARVAKLKRLDLHFHYVSADGLAKLERLGVEIDASDVQEPDVWNGEPQRYVAVAE